METILICGGTGLVGSQMITTYSSKYEVKVLSRSKRQDSKNVSYFTWDIEKETMDEAALDGVDYIINLTGAGIADGRWTESRKKILVDSRVQSNKTLAKYIAKLDKKIKAFTCASAVGYYGERGEEVLTEGSPPGVGFMADCCVAWEESAYLLESLVARLSILRIGIVLSTKDGALPKMLMTKNFGILSYFGDGSQYYAWIHISDLVKIFESTLVNSTYKGVYNAVAPAPITNKQMMEGIKDKMDSSALLLPAPSFALRLVMGEMADVVLNSTRVVPSRLLEQGYKYLFTNVGEAVRDVVEKKI